MIYGLETPRWLGEGPFVLPHEGKMAANFGERRVYNNVPRSSHAGVDIAAGEEAVPALERRPSQSSSFTTGKSRRAKQRVTATQAQLAPS